MGPKSLCWWLRWYPCLEDDPSGPFGSGLNRFCCCFSRRSISASFCWRRRFFPSFFTPNFTSKTWHGESVLDGPSPIWRPQCTNLMVVGQENDVHCLINLSRSGDILVQICIAWETKIDPLVSCFWPTGWPTSTKWILVPLAEMDLFGLIWVGKNLSVNFRAGEGN